MLYWMPPPWCCPQFPPQPHVPTCLLTLIILCMCPHIVLYSLQWALLSSFPGKGLHLPTQIFIKTRGAQATQSLWCPHPSRGTRMSRLLHVSFLSVYVLLFINLSLVVFLEGRGYMCVVFECLVPKFNLKYTWQPILVEWIVTRVLWSVSNASLQLTWRKCTGIQFCWHLPISQEWEQVPPTLRILSGMQVTLSWHVVNISQDRTLVKNLYISKHEKSCSVVLQIFCLQCCLWNTRVLLIISKVIQFLE